MSGAGPVVEPGAPPRIGAYRVAAVIGRSTSCTVYLAMGPDDAWVALKVLDFERMGDERAIARFRKDWETARELQHPNLVRVLDAGLDDPFAPWVALEVCEGGTLRDRVEAIGPMAPFQAIEVMVQVTSALSTAHRAGVAQRRLTLGDVLLDRAGTCKLGDFRRVVQGASLGSDSVDLREDVVAAGLLLYGLLTGGASAVGALSGIPDALQQVVAKSQARGRGQGYADAAAMARDLEAAMLEVSLPAGPVPPLVSADAELPASFDALFDVDEAFESLQQAARWASDPEAAPPKVEMDSEAIFRRLGGQLPSPARPAPKVREAGAKGYTPSGLRAPPSFAPVDGGSLLPKTPVSRPPPAPAPPAETPLVPAAISRAAAPFEDSVTPAPAKRAAEGFRPSYLADEPVQARDESWLKATPQPVRRVTAQEERRQVNPIVGVLGVVAFLAVLFSLFGAGAYTVRGARAAAEDAGEGLAAVIEAEGAVVNDLVGKGADRALLEERFFTYKDARGSSRYAAADAFAVALEQEARRVGLDLSAPSAADDAVVRRVGEILTAHARYQEERQAWSDAARGFPGIFPVMVGLSRAP